MHFKPYDHDENNEQDRLAMEESRRRESVEAAKKYSPSGVGTSGQTALHVAAVKGDLAALEKVLAHAHGRDLIHARDENDWQAIHEAAKSGNLQVQLCRLSYRRNDTSTTLQISFNCPSTKLQLQVLLDENPCHPTEYTV